MLLRNYRAIEFFKPTLYFYPMKKIIFLAIAIIYTCTTFAQQTYQVSKDSVGTPIYKGIISKEVIEKDTITNKWFSASYKAYSPIAAAVTTLQQKGGAIQFMVFGGTWCEDTHFLLPRFFAWLNAAGYDASKVTLIGVDRKKQSLDNSTADNKITNVPTFIVLKNGKEIGRMVEYGKYSQPDKELAEIIDATE